jgi:hypothetical protein
MHATAKTITMIRAKNFVFISSSVFNLRDLSQCFSLNGFGGQVEADMPYSSTGARLRVPLERSG